MEKTLAEKPFFCTPQELERDVQKIHRQFYSIPSMLRRLPMPMNVSSIASWVLNFSQRKVSAHADSEHNFTAY